jgi:hypothetical protein
MYVYVMSPLTHDILPLIIPTINLNNHLKNLIQKNDLILEYLII